MTYLLAAVLGIVQGLTEFLPISSTAHLLLVGQSLGYQDPGGVFTVMIQFGSVLAVMWLYRAKIIGAFLGLRSDPAARHFAFMLIIASIPAGVAGLLLADWVKSRLYASPAVIAYAFIIGGVAILLIERFRPRPIVFEADKTPVSRAFAVGVCQMLALVPGVSRSGATIMGGLLARLDRPAAAEFSFFLAMPALGGAFLHDLWEVRDHLAPERGAEIAIGFVMAFFAALVVVKPFVRYVARSRFRPLCVVPHRGRSGDSRGAGSGMALMQWLRRSFLAGFFVTVPLVISVAALVWIFGIIDGFTAPLARRALDLLGVPVAGTLQDSVVRFAGLLITLLVVLTVGVVATNVIGRRLLARAEGWLMLIPVFRTIYSPVKQLIVAFSPDSETGFKRVVMVDDPSRGWVMGFLTKEFEVDRGKGPETLMAVYVPTNHLYLGDIVIYPRERAIFPDISVEEGVRIFLTGGMSLPSRIEGKTEGN